VEGFVIKQHPVTNGEYLSFLNDLLASGRGDDARRYQPRHRGRGGQGATIYVIEHGRFVPGPDADGDIWPLDWPILLVTWHAALAYAAWYAEQTGDAWRLPTEWEWVKAAAGVDGRAFPWGDAIDASWAQTSRCAAGESGPTAVGARPRDVSPYGVMGMAGNARDWCWDVFRDEGSPLDEDRIARPPPLGDERAARTTRGGSWGQLTRRCRVGDRVPQSPGIGFDYVSFRLARPL